MLNQDPENTIEHYSLVPRLSYSIVSIVRAVCTVGGISLGTSPVKHASP